MYNILSNTKSVLVWSVWRLLCVIMDLAAQFVNDWFFVCSRFRVNWRMLSYVFAHFDLSFVPLNHVCTVICIVTDQKIYIFPLISENDWEWIMLTCKPFIPMLFICSTCMCVKCGNLKAQIQRIISAFVIILNRKCLWNIF